MSKIKFYNASNKATTSLFLAVANTWESWGLVQDKVLHLEVAECRILHPVPLLQYGFRLSLQALRQWMFSHSLNLLYNPNPQMLPLCWLVMHHCKSSTISWVLLLCSLHFWKHWDQWGIPGMYITTYRKNLEHFSCWQKYQTYIPFTAP